MKVQKNKSNFLKRRNREYLETHGNGDMYDPERYIQAVDQYNVDYLDDFKEGDFVSCYVIPKSMGMILTEPRKKRKRYWLEDGSYQYITEYFVDVRWFVEYGRPIEDGYRKQTVDNILDLRKFRPWRGFHKGSEVEKESALQESASSV